MAALAIARIQYVYQLEVSDLMSGRVGGRDTGVHLFADDAQFIAEERLSQSLPLVPTSNAPEYALAVEWLEVGYK